MWGQRSTTAVLVVSDAVLLWLLHPEVVGAGVGLSTPREWLLRDGADRVAITLAAAGLWCVAAWVGLALVAVLASRLPGAAGRGARRFASVALPAVLRRLVAGSAGLGIVLTPITAATAAAADVPDGPGGRPVAAAQSASGAPLPGPSWPGGGDDLSRAATPGASPDSPPAGPAWPSRSQSPPDASQPPARTPPSATASPTQNTRPPSASTSPPAIPAPPPGASTPGTPVRTPRPEAPGTATVRADESLWLLGARRLGPQAHDADIAAYVSDLYRANRDVIGDDPDLVRPGQQLTLPAPDTATRAPGGNPR